MRVRYTDTALDEIEDILAHIADDNPIAAAKVATAITVTIARLSTYPLLATETDVPAVRMTIARPYSYLIFYSTDGDRLVIRNVRHPARRRPPSEQS